MKHTCRALKSQRCQEHELTQPFKFKEAWLAVYYKSTSTRAAMEGVLVSFIIVADRVMSAEQPARKHLWERWINMADSWGIREISWQRNEQHSHETTAPRWKRRRVLGAGSDYGRRRNFRIQWKIIMEEKTQDDRWGPKWKRTLKSKCLWDLDTLVTFLWVGESDQDKEGDILLDSGFQGGLKHSRDGW